MDFEFSNDQEMLRESVRRFLSERAPISYVRACYDAPSTGRDDVWSGLVALGVVGLGMLDSAVVLEELGRALSATPFASSAIGAATFRPPSEAIGTVALFEEGRRYDWRTPATRARPEGDAWRLDGVKVHVPDACSAEVVYASAVDSSGDLGVFEVEEVVAESTPTVDGTRKEGRVILNGALGRRVGEAVDIAACLDRLAVAYVIDGVGVAQRALELAVEYAKERVQFDKPIGAFQAVQHLCADMLKTVELGRAAGHYACWAIDNADASEAHRAATLAQAFASEAFAQLGGSAIQVFGGIGFTWEHDIHLYYKRLLTMSVALGTTDDHLAELAAIAID
ncbi:MAG: acyl-CoA dehydrogenase family protein [Actinomycetota bacterium]